MYDRRLQLADVAEYSPLPQATQCFFSGMNSEIGAQRRLAQSIQRIEEHGVKYAGHWVALDGDRHITSGQSEEEVASAARADGAYLPRPGEPDEIGF